MCASVLHSVPELGGGRHRPTGPFAQLRADIQGAIPQTRVNRNDFSVDSNHLLALDCHCRIGAINFGCSAGTPARGTAADRSVTSTRA